MACTNKRTEKAFSVTSRDKTISAITNHQEGDEMADKVNQIEPARNARKATNARKLESKEVVAPKLTARQLRVYELAEMLGVSVQTVWRWDKQGRIPKGRRLSPAITVWGSDVIDAWLHSTQTA